MFTFLRNNPAKPRGRDGERRVKPAHPDRTAAEGNTIWQSLAQRPAGIQPKLTAGPPDNPYEQSAERVADQVMRIPEAKIQRACSGNGGVCEATTANQPGDESSHSPKERGVANNAPANVGAHGVDQALNSPGRPLEPSTRMSMESRLGRDFGGVRIRADSAADSSARSLNALAYTIGQNIVFQKDAYAPSTSAGQKLIAHELVHVAQQSAGGQAEASDRSNQGPELAAKSAKVSAPIMRAPAISAPHDPAEREADTVAERVMRGDNVHHVTAVPAATIHRAPPPTPATDEAPSQFFPKQPSPLLSGFVFFPTGKHVLSADDNEVVTQLVNETAERADFNEIDFDLDGFADERPIAGEPEGNQVLSERRAAAVKSAIQLRADSLPDGLRKKALKRSTITARGHGVRAGGADQALKRSVEIKYVIKPTLYQRKLITWNPSEPERFAIAGAGVTPRKLAIDLYGDELLGTEMSVVWDAKTEGPLGVDTEMPVGKWARIQYQHLRPNLQTIYDLTVPITSRSKWGARPPILGDPNRSYDPYTGKLEDILTGIAVHHSGNSNKHTMKEVQDHHLDEKEAADINYHYGIDLQGQTYEGRPINVKGAHLKGVNTGNIGIVLLADLDTGYTDNDDDLTPAMEAALLRLIHYLMGKYPKIEKLGGHLEFASGQGDDRSCPGDLTMAKIGGWRSSTNLKKP